MSQVNHQAHFLKTFQNFIIFLLYFQVFCLAVFLPDKTMYSLFFALDIHNSDHFISISGVDTFLFFSVIPSLIKDPFNP